LYFPLSLRTLHSFPTRRSSDLEPVSSAGHPREALTRPCLETPPCQALTLAVALRALADAGLPPEALVAAVVALLGAAEGIQAPRSEEHTSELQSRFDLVCRLLL